jgi:predicted lipid-binding transport protein (Tim44 family)
LCKAFAHILFIFIIFFVAWQVPSHAEYVQKQLQNGLTDPSKATEKYTNTLPGCLEVTSASTATATAIATTAATATTATHH